MTKEQENKFEKWNVDYIKYRPLESAKKEMIAAWEACLEANGIGEIPEPSEFYRGFRAGLTMGIEYTHNISVQPKGGDMVEAIESAAPQWVIDMMLTGKPVRCEVSNDEEEWERQAYVTGHDVKAVDAFSDEYGTTWKYARLSPHGFRRMERRYYSAMRIIKAAQCPDLFGVAYYTHEGLCAQTGKVAIW